MNKCKRRQKRETYGGRERWNNVLSERNINANDYFKKMFIYINANDDRTNPQRLKVRERNINANENLHNANDDRDKLRTHLQQLIVEFEREFHLKRKHFC